MTQLNPVEVALAAAVVALVLLQAFTMVRFNRTVRAFRRLSRVGSGEGLDRLLERTLDSMGSTAREVEELRRDHENLSLLSRRALQRVGMVRFNAYSDTGGDQSFALALTDEEGNGTVLNGLFHRSECRVYAKPVAGWRSSYALTDEEEEALRKARAAER